MIVTLLTWISMVIGSLLLLLLMLPFRISLHGQADDRKGLSYEIALDWAFGVIAFIVVHGQPARLFFFGFKIWSFSIEWGKKEKAKKKSERKRFSAQTLFQWTKEHFQQIAMILKRFARAVFLKGYIEGWIGLPDPADTARIDLLCQQLRISKDRFKLAVYCVYDREIIKINAKVQATLIMGYLGLVAIGLLLEKKTRVMIRGLAQT
jgi:hypothetical protein